MSNIFDALQRSDGEQEKSDSSGPVNAPELLRRAERRAGSKGQTASRTAQAHGRESAARDTAMDVFVELPDAAAQQGSTASEVLPAGGVGDLFAQIPWQKASPAPQDRIVSLTDSESHAAEAFRLLAVRLRDLRRNRPLKKVLITSTVPQEGKSMVAANLACTLARKKKQRTLLLEGDLRRPSLSQGFGLGANPGLCEYLRDDRALTASIYHLEGPDLWILPAGSAPSNALDLLQTGKLPELMDQLSAWFEWIIIDSPPVLPLADTSVWIRMAEGILLVTRQGFTEKRQLRRGLEALEPNKLIGALLNSSSHSAHSDYYYYGSSKVSQANDHSNG